MTTLRPRPRKARARRKRCRRRRSSSSASTAASSARSRRRWTRPAAFKHKKKNAKTRPIVKVKPGKYVEGVVLDGHAEEEGLRRADDHRAKKNPRKTILEGKNAKGELGAGPERHRGGRRRRPRDSRTCGRATTNRTASSSTPRRRAASTATATRWNNLLASGNRSYGLFAKGCLGGKMLNSTGFRQGDSAFYVGETPCDTTTWTNHGSAPVPCQAKPKWTVLRERRELRKRARLLRHQLEVRADRRIGLLQQRRRHRAQHARQRGLRAERLERVRKEQRVLEQLQLLPRRLVVQNGLRRARASSPG